MYFTFWILVIAIVTYESYENKRIIVVQNYQTLIEFVTARANFALIFTNDGRLIAFKEVDKVKGTR